MSYNQVSYDRGSTVNDFLQKNSTYVKNLLKYSKFSKSLQIRLVNSYYMNKFSIIPSWLQI